MTYVRNISLILSAPRLPCYLFSLSTCKSLPGEKIRIAFRFKDVFDFPFPAWLYGLIQFFIVCLFEWEKEKQTVRGMPKVFPRTTKHWEKTWKGWKIVRWEGTCETVNLVRIEFSDELNLFWLSSRHPFIVFFLKGRQEKRAKFSTFQRALLLSRILCWH